MRAAYWARFFKEADGRFSVDVPDLPGCLTHGNTVEQAYQLLVNEAIPLWLEDQPWPAARGADEILAAPRYNGAPEPILVRVAIDEVGGSAAGSWPFWSSTLNQVRRRFIGH